MQTSYNNCIKTLFALGRFGIKPGLESISHLLHELDNPHKSFKSIHIAGTNGKGSTAAYIASILAESGIRTGLFTSPHLIKFNERISINGHNISDRDVSEYFERTKRADKGQRPATFFEYATAMAFDYFAKNDTEYAVIETGMGGRFDTTNIILPEVSIITSISQDHSVWLGDSEEKIAFEKSGIIKQGIPVITGDIKNEALQVIQSVASDKNAKIYRMGKNFKTEFSENSKAEYSGIHEEKISGLKIPLEGDHQLSNTGMAIAACEILMGKKAGITKQSIKKGIAETSWPGRIEYIRKNPDIILDGAHNPDAAEKFISYLEKKYPDRKICAIIGMMADKDQKKTLQPFSEICSEIIFTSSKTARAEKPENLVKIVKNWRIPVSVIPELEKAIIHAVEKCPADTVIIITGSLYVAGEAKAFFEKTTAQTAPN